MVALIRPSHWIKNSLVFAAPLFAARLTDPQVFLRTALAFVAFCAASSAVYVYNVWRDAERDRAHPIKATRPLASGSVDKRLALGMGSCWLRQDCCWDWPAAPWWLS
jgi:decaprenyl-phosphate phosphoribosyltransferase